MVGLRIASCLALFHYPFSRATIMNSDEMYNWPDGDVIRQAAHGTNSRDFRVHNPSSPSHHPLSENVQIPPALVSSLGRRYHWHG